MKNCTVFVCVLDEHVDFCADTPASAFDWVEENAPGLDFELFEDGRSVARVHHLPDNVRGSADEAILPK